MKNLLLVGLICLAAALSGSESAAKSMAKIMADSGLSPEDFEIMGQQAATLYTVASPRKGATTQWKNDATRSYGTVILMGMPKNCAVLRHLIYTKGAKKAREFRLRRCKTSDGSWILQ